MNRLDYYISSNPNQMHFIPFITAGDPNKETTIKLALALEELGASAIELGIPYSDPLADGPVIQRASIRALNAGMTLKKAFDIVSELRKEGLGIPVIIFTYYNLLLQLGEKELSESLKTCGADGLLVPDLPYEESESLKGICQASGIKLIYLVAPTTSETRLKRIGQEAEGFLYCVSSLGVTGVRHTFHPALRSFLESVREAASCPVAVGFGISSSEQVQALSGMADGYIVGSAIVKEVEARIALLSDAATRDDAVADIKKTLSHKLLSK
ncbi:MAG: tryptophan synthase subunit alpha [Tuberibacillus sp.]